MSQPNNDFSAALLAELETGWRSIARPAQLAPEGDDWAFWLIMAGRGFGKTRSGAEWIIEQVAADAKRVAIVGATAADVRDVMVEGESGILACSPPWDRPIYEPSKRRLAWPNGAIGTTYSADEPQRLRGPQHDAAWCDEIASWRYPAAFDMLLFGLRLGAQPRCVITTTPRPVKIIRELLARDDCVVTRGSTSENAANPIATLGALRFVIGSLDPEPPLLQSGFAFGFQPLSGGEGGGKPSRLQGSDEGPSDGLVDLATADIEAIDAAVLDENLARAVVTW